MEFLKTRGQRSMLHASMQDAMGVPPHGTYDCKYLQQQALIEAVCWAEDHAEVFTLASKIDGFIYATLWEAKAKYAQVDVEDLRGQYSSKTISIALRLSGVRPKQLGAKTVWTTAPGEEAALFVKLPFDLVDK